jgi:hypothetical protein
LLALPEKQRRPLREQLGLTKGEVDCYALIQRRVIYCGVARFSNAELARELKVKPRMVRYYIAHLVQLGLVEKLRITGQCNEYFLLEHAWMHEPLHEHRRVQTSVNDGVHTSANSRDTTGEERRGGWQSTAKGGWQSTATILEFRRETTDTPPSVGVYNTPSPPIENEGGTVRVSAQNTGEEENRVSAISSDHQEKPSHAKRLNPRARGENPRAIAARETARQREEAWRSFWQSATGQRLWNAVITHDDCTRSHTDQPYDTKGCPQCRDLITWAENFERSGEVPLGIVCRVEEELEQRRPHAPVPESVRPVQLSLPLFAPNDPLYIQAGEIARTEAAAAGIKSELVSQDRIRAIYQELHEHPERGKDPSQEGVECLWQYVLQDVRTRVDPIKYQTWLEPLAPVSVAGKALCLAVPNKFVRAWVMEHYQPLIIDALQAITGDRYQVTFVVQQEGEP